MNISEKLKPKVKERQEKSTQIGVVMDKFAEQAVDSPGNDPYIKAFYQAVGSLYREEPKFQEFISDVLSKRDNVTPEHFVNVFFRGVQYIELFEKENKKYPKEYKEERECKKELLSLIDDHGPQFKEIITNRDTTTTIYQRYAGPKFALQTLFPGKELLVADFGCGGNYGLRGLASDEPFSDLTNDDSPGQVVSRLIKKGLTIKEGLAVDKADPNDDDTRKWRFACRFYPQSLVENHDALERLADFEIHLDGLEQNANIRFLQGDLLKLEVNHHDGTLPVSHFNAIIISTILYQMIPPEQKQIIDNGIKSLAPGGVIISSEFAKTDPDSLTGLDFNVNWGDAEDYPYRMHILSEATLWKPKSVIEWKSGRSEAVRPGPDFHLLSGSERNGLKPTKKSVIFQPTKLHTK